MQQYQEGDTVKCINSEGWSHFETGEIYTVTATWGGAVGGFDLDGHAVAYVLGSDFELVKAVNHG